MGDKSNLKLNTIAGLAVFSGFVTLGSVLGALLHPRMARIVLADAHFTVIAGISLMYLATLLRRGKYNAWLISLPIYVFLVLRNLRHFLFDVYQDERVIIAALNLLLPILVLALLVAYRALFRVRSESRSFALATRRSIFILAVAFLYGLGGFAIMDEHDFHQELGIQASAHYTIDQLGLTTSKQITPYTRRANLFLDSLAAVSLGSVFYTAVSFFAPIRFRLRHNPKELVEAHNILSSHSHTSEDFFKLWPRDKAYFFSPDRRAIIAYKVVSGVALAVGDPAGPSDSIRQLVSNFLEYCRLNDWLPAFIHTEPTYLKLYKQLGLNSQKIGQEAVVDVDNFNNQVVTNKYFRHINNRFSKLGYSCELLAPPYDEALLKKLADVSAAWLKIPGKTERGFMMGYFNNAYLQLCQLMIVRDERSDIQAFLNQVPSPRSDEANYDFLRSSSSAPGNINDFLMLNFLAALKDKGFKRLNMGLAPLSGLAVEAAAKRSVVDGLLQFVYANADRFYSFQGLARFKSKYEPHWQSRYIVYSGGVPGLTKTMNALIRAMRIEVK